MQRFKGIMTSLLALGGAGSTCSYVANTATTINESPEAWTTIVETAKGAQAMVETVATGQVISAAGMVIGFGGAFMLWAQPRLVQRFPHVFGSFSQPYDSIAPSAPTAAPTLAMQASEQTKSEEINDRDNLPSRPAETAEEKAAKHQLIMFIVESLLPAIEAQKKIYNSVSSLLC